jgi:hypothetical protein
MATAGACSSSSLAARRQVGVLQARYRKFPDYRAARAVLPFSDMGIKPFVDADRGASAQLLSPARIGTGHQE